MGRRDNAELAVAGVVVCAPVIAAGCLGAALASSDVGSDLPSEFTDIAKHGRATKAEWCDQLTMLSGKLADFVKAASDDPAVTPAFVITQQDCENVLKPTPTKPAPAPLG